MSIDTTEGECGQSKKQWQRRARITAIFFVRRHKLDAAFGFFWFIPKAGIGLRFVNGFEEHYERCGNLDESGQAFGLHREVNLRTLALLCRDQEAQVLMLGLPRNDVFEVTHFAFIRQLAGQIFLPLPAKNRRNLQKVLNLILLCFQSQTKPAKRLSVYIPPTNCLTNHSIPGFSSYLPGDNGG